MDAPLRIAAWSGPRNISTAMMRAWENRADTFVTDEPFYAHYLANTSNVHPGQQEILASQPTDWQEVVNNCIKSVKPGCSVHYQKHMTQHILPHIPLDWLVELKNIFLIRAPDAVVASYSKSRPNPDVSDLGFMQQARLFDAVKVYLGTAPLVIDSVKLLQKPKEALKLLCADCAIPFDEKMLQWPAGKRESDGVWAPYWYHSVEASTGFGTPREQQTINLDKNQQQIADQCWPYYESMAQHCVDF